MTETEGGIGGGDGKRGEGKSDKSNFDYEIS